MTVALGTTLINLQISTLIKKGSVGWQRIEDGYTNGVDIFIGAAVTRFGETRPDTDLCSAIEAIWGFVVGLNTNLKNLPDGGAWFNDFDNPFANNVWIRVGIPQTLGIYLVLSATNVNIAIGAKIYCVDGVFTNATTDLNYQMIAEQAVTGAGNTRKYFYASWVKN